MPSSISSFAAFVTGAFLALSCGRSSSPIIESETHFLSDCLTTCDDGLECLCGVCTRACEPGEDSCDGLASGATCVESTVVCGRPGPATVCDVECSSNADCSSLEGDATCDDGKCRSHGSGGGTGGAGAGGSGNGGAGNGGAGEGGSSGAQNGGAGGGDTLSCEEYADPTDASPVSIVVTNARQVPIQLGGPSCTAELVTITSENEATPGTWGGSHCLNSCGSASGGVTGCPTICLFPPTVVLDPGESTEIMWAGLVGEQVSFDAQCCLADDPSECSAQCTLLRPAALGSYRATLYYTDLSPETATACEEDISNCPLGFGGVQPTEVELPFSIGGGPVSLEITGEDSGVLSCEQLDESPTPSPVSITVRNGRENAVVLDSYSDCPDFFTVDAVSSTTSGTWHPLFCGGDCAGADGPSPVCGACAFPEPIVLEPGETTSFEWPGLIGGDVSFPRECCDTEPCPTSCTRYVEAEDGQYRVNLRVADATEEEAAQCEAEPESCEASLVNGGNSMPVGIAFEHTGDAVTVEIESAQ